MSPPCGQWSPSGSSLQGGHGPLHSASWGIGNSQPLSDELLEGFSLKTASKQASNFSDNFLEDSLNLMQNEETFLRIKLKSQSHYFSCFKDCRFGFMNNASQILQQNSTYFRTNEKQFLSESLNWPVLGWILFCSEFENFVMSYNIWWSRTGLWDKNELIFVWNEVSRPRRSPQDSKNETGGLFSPL